MVRITIIAGKQRMPCPVPKARVNYHSRLPMEFVPELELRQYSFHHVHLTLMVIC
jgi:hypothetical protein